MSEQTTTRIRRSFLCLLALLLSFLPTGCATYAIADAHIVPKPVDFSFEKVTLRDGNTLELRLIEAGGSERRVSWDLSSYSKVESIESNGSIHWEAIPLVSQRDEAQGPRSGSGGVPKGAPVAIRHSWKDPDRGEPGTYTSYFYDNINFIEVRLNEGVEPLRVYRFAVPKREGLAGGVDWVLKFVFLLPVALVIDAGFPITYPIAYWGAQGLRFRT